MDVIGAGLARTATTTTLFAFEKLGFGPVQHMRDVLGDLEGQLPRWERVVAGNPDWDEIFGHARACCDVPASRFYKELADYYPQAKVVLSVREPEGWVRSMRETVWAVYFGGSLMNHICRARQYLDPLWDRYIKVMEEILWNENGALHGDHESDEGLAALFEAWTAQVKRDIPAERLLIWKPQDGWEPLCAFLDVPVPDEPLPNVNDTAAFVDGITSGGIAAINEGWAKLPRAAGGLHGAPAGQN
ncbi:MAG: sulfotransferase family protein [Solirubrobacteraceae bacterium]|jgi:hypothetical protein